ncbi:MAG: SdiA-regulated domain-containing protein [Gemmatimonadota bacterium]
MPFLCRALLASAVGCVAPVAAQTEAPGDSAHPPFDTSKRDLHWTLPAALTEISGLAFTPDGRLYTHHDEAAVIFELDPDSGTVRGWFQVGRPALKGDFEGLTYTGDRFVLLRSSGELLEFKEGPPGGTVPFIAHRLALPDDCNAEGLATLAGDTLVAICKNPSRRRGRMRIYLVSPAPDREVFQRLSVDARPLRKWGMEEEVHPSGVTPLQGTASFLVVAARENVLLEVDRRGNILGAVQLKRRRHPQPEGIAVDASGRLYLADEGGNHAPRLTRYLPTRKHRRAGHR